MLKSFNSICIRMVYDFYYYWWPWTNLNFECVFFQFCVFYLLFLCYSSRNIYYTLVYVFLIFFFFGVYLAFWQVEVFTGFLWLLELTILFVYLLVLFYLNFKGYTNSLKTKEYFLNKYVFGFIYLFFSYLFVGTSENYTLFEELNSLLIWENYYEPFTNFGMNDLTVFLLSYYYFNSLEFVIVGLILFIGSIVCVNLYKTSKGGVAANVNKFLTFFDFYKDSWNYNFLRKQNLVNQNLTLPATRVVSKKH